VHTTTNKYPDEAEQTTRTGRAYLGSVLHKEQTKHGGYRGKGRQTTFASRLSRVSSGGFFKEDPCKLQSLG
jgi:hypothetical protein